MLLPGRLKDTTLGDLLGTLYRARATGQVCLIEDAGKPHTIVLRDGLVHEVVTELGPRLGDLLVDADRYGPDAARAELRLGQYLLQKGRITPERLSAVLYRLQLLKLDQLFLLREASIRFHVARPAAPDESAPAPLDMTALLDGRPRKRRSASGRRPPTRVEALSVLGLDARATQQDVRSAFRTLAQRFHPDRHPDVSSIEKTRLVVQFSRITHAYHALLG